MASPLRQQLIEDLQLHGLSYPIGRVGPPRCPYIGWHPRCAITFRIPSATPQPSYILVTPASYHIMGNGAKMG
jgi:hypothetical protein